MTAALPAFQEKRDRMVIDQLLDRGISDPAVLRAMAAVPRHLFVPSKERSHAYEDRPLSIGFDQTISQPYIVALMCEALKIAPGMKVLEVGTGSGYQAAILDRLGVRVFSIERIPALAEGARDRLKRLKTASVRIREGDGAAGWPEEAPFDRIVVAAAAKRRPAPLWKQLADGGRMVLPVAVERSGAPENPAVPAAQNLMLIERQGKEEKSWELCKCLFVPLVTADD